MSKKLFFYLVMPALIIVLTGCTSKVSLVDNNTSNEQAANQGAFRNGRMPDFGQPDRAADLRGVVTSIIGNEVTVLEIAANQGRRASSSLESQNASSTQSLPSISLTGSTNMPRGAQGGFGGPEGGPGRNESGTTDRATMLASLKAMSTGQSKISVPVGIQMMKSETAADGKRTMVEASLADISADKMITVWLNTSVSDKKIADFILIN